MIQNLEQLRAKNAFSFIKNVSTMNGKKREEIANRINQLPVMFHTNGMLATFAFLLSKNKEGKLNEMLENLLKHLKETKRFIVPSDFNAYKIYLGGEAWIEPGRLQTNDFFTITDEMIKYSTWLKRAAEALMPN